jgi:putative membrane protein
VGILRFAGWLLTNALALAVAAQLFDGIGFGAEGTSDKIWPLIFVALILGLVSSFVSPVLKLLSIPFIIITLGLFLLVINALMLLFTEWLADLFDIDFFVNGFWTAVGGAIVITIVTWIVGLVLGESDD